MIHRIGRKNFNIFAFDLESHNDLESISKGETSMWLGCLLNEESKVEDESSFLYSIKELLDKLQELSTPKRKHGETKRPCKNVCVFIYNLSFEYSFILPTMLNEFNFRFKEKIEDEDEFVFNSVSTKSCSSVWSATLKFTKKSGLVVFRDMAKLFSGGLKNVAKAFSLETQKGEIDYRKNRLHNYEITKEEKEYCFKDTRILVEILLRIIDDKDFWNAISISSYSMKKMIKYGYPRKMKPYKAFREEYPELLEDETKMLRMGVAGGITYAPKSWQFKVIDQPIYHIDKHQMHPSSAYFNLFPYGFGEYFTGEPHNFAIRINLCHIRVSYDDVRLHSIIQLIGIDFVYDRELVVWDFEIPTMKKCYVNLKIEYIDGYSYRCKPLPWREYYAHNYRERLKAKAVHDDYNTQLYKLLNNSSYGKLLENPHNYIIENIIDSYGIIDSMVIDKKPEDIRINAKYTYLPVGSCIPAYSRVDLIETALKFGWQKILYFDTDSIFVLKDKETEKVFNTLDFTDFLGCWGLEEIIDKAQFTAPKRYKTETDGKTTIKAGGFNFNNYIENKAKELKLDKYAVEFDEINLVNSSWKVQRAYRCKGGTLIEFETKEIKVADKYMTTYEKNVNMLLDELEL